jgi:hypothetical protein
MNSQATSGTDTNKNYYLGYHAPIEKAGWVAGY